VWHLQNNKRLVIKLLNQQTTEERCLTSSTALFLQDFMTILQRIPITFHTTCIRLMNGEHTRSICSKVYYLQHIQARLLQSTTSTTFSFCLTRQFFHGSPHGSNKSFKTASDGVKDTDGKAKAKDIQHKPKSLCHGDLSLWMDVMSESSCDKNASLALLHLVRIGTN